MTQDDVILDEKPETTSFLPVNINVRKQNQIVTEKFNERYQWTIEETPFNEFNTEILASTLFPTLFPDSNEDLRNCALLRNIADSDTESFALKINHWLDLVNASMANGFMVLHHTPDLNIGHITFFTNIVSLAKGTFL